MRVSPQFKRALEAELRRILAGQRLREDSSEQSLARVERALQSAQRIFSTMNLASNAKVTPASRPLNMAVYDARVYARQDGPLGQELVSATGAALDMHKKFEHQRAANLVRGALDLVKTARFS